MKKHASAFNNAYTQLNQEQKQAVNAIDGPVMVVAGPGTGKTQILATRIANILLRTDTSAHNILALTFTESGAKAMRERLLSIIGPDAYYTNISTFHSFCSDIIQSHPEYFTFSKEAEPLSELERVTLIEKHIRSEQFTEIKPINAPLLYVKDCIKSIQDLKRENIPPEKYRKMIENETVMLRQDLSISATEKKRREKNLTRNLELLQLYILYQHSLQKNSRYDYEDMISFVSVAFTKHDELLRMYQERLQYILVDEFQDTNNAQNSILTLLASYWGQQANMFVVGDVSQSIYRFQGASAENALRFAEMYPNANIITLSKNYRSTQIILQNAYELISHNTFTHKTVLKKFASKKNSIEDKLFAMKKYAQLPISLAVFPSSPLEPIYVAEKIQEHISSGVPPKEIAILYRNNRDGEPFEQVLSSWGIPHDVQGKVNVIDIPEIQQLLLLFRVIHSTITQPDDPDVFTVMNFTWIGLDALDILKLSWFAHKRNISMYETIFHADLQSAQLEHIKKIQEFAKNLLYWLNLDSNKTLPEWFEIVIKGSGYMRWILEHKNHVTLLNQLQSLFREIKALSRSSHECNLAEFLQTIKLMQHHHISISEEELRLQRNVVTLSTVHSAKGQEWEYVFIVNAIEKKWDKSKKRNLITLPEGILTATNLDEKEKSEDERRVFYVAVTRAKKQVNITYANTTISGNKVTHEFPSMFIHELSLKHLKKVQLETFEKTYAETLQKQFAEPDKDRMSVKESEWLSMILKNFILSPTALNTYLECPLKFKLNVLCKVPRAKQPFFAFGSAVHKALENMGSSMQSKHTVPEKALVIKTFEKALEKEVLTQEEFQARLKKGVEILSKYYDQYAHAFIEPLFVEKSLGYGWPKIFMDDIQIGGKIDKIEPIDHKKKTVRVIDYKTGKARTRNDIEGKTASSTGSYKRQLIFYKLLTDLDRSFPYTVEEEVFDFIEPEKRTGKFKKEIFRVSNEDMKDLKQTIREVMKKVRALEFPAGTDAHDCETCELALFCKRRKI